MSMPNDKNRSSMVSVIWELMVASRHSDAISPLNGQPKGKKKGHTHNVQLSNVLTKFEEEYIKD